MKRYLRGVLVSKIAVVFTTAIVSSLPPATADMAVTHQITITEFEYQPATLTVKPGDIVVWLNRDIVAHTVTATDRSWNTGLLRPQQRVSIVITREQTLSYYCAYHPLMKARLRFARAHGEAEANGER